MTKASRLADRHVAARGEAATQITEAIAMASIFTPFICAVHDTAKALHDGKIASKLAGLVNGAVSPVQFWHCRRHA